MADSVTVVDFSALFMIAVACTMCAQVYSHCGKVFDGSRRLIAYWLSSGLSPPHFVNVVVVSDVLLFSSLLNLLFLFI